MAKASKKEEAADTTVDNSVNAGTEDVQGEEQAYFLPSLGITVSALTAAEAEEKGNAIAAKKAAEAEVAAE